MLTYAGIGLICFGGGLISGMAGFGSLILIVPALILLLGIETAVPLGVLCGVTSQTFNATANRAAVDKKILLRMFLGAVPGVFLGVFLLVRMPELILRAVLGVFVIGYVLWTVSGKLAAPSHELAPGWATAAGFFSGAFGGAFGINGPPMMMYISRTGWTPQIMRAYLGFFCALLFYFQAFTLLARGLFGLEVLLYALVAMPTCLFGASCGYIVARHLRPEQYMRLIFLLLFIMGLSLCWPALRVFLTPAAA